MAKYVNGVKEEEYKRDKDIATKGEYDKKTRTLHVRALRKMTSFIPPEDWERIFGKKKKCKKKG